jgi:DNA-binding NarL/FixJ family response regulator
MKVIICDDQAIVRDGLEMLLNLEKDIQVIGVAQDGAEALELLSARSDLNREDARRAKVTFNQEDLASFAPLRLTDCDLVLMDLKMPGINGVEATRRIRALYPEVKVLVLTTFDDDEWVFDAIRAGASGYLLKDTPREKVIEAIRGTVAGKSYVDPAVAGKLLDQAAANQIKPSAMITNKLTEREEAVLRLLARGLNNIEIANRLHLSEGTVRNHVSAIFSKLDVSDRTQAAIIAIQHGLDK